MSSGNFTGTIMLAGQPLIVDNKDKDLEKFINKYIPTSSFLPWERRSWPGFGTAGITYPNNYRGEPAFKINKFRWPTGASRWAYGHFLSDVSQCNLDGIINASIPQSGGPLASVPFILDTSNSGGETLSTNVFIASVTPLSGIRGANGLYLISIVDQRFYWWNVSMGAFSVNTSTTWMSLYQYIFSQLSISSFTIDSISTKYLQPSTMFNLNYEQIPIILDAVAANVGHRVVVNYDGSVYCQNYNTAVGLLSNDFINNPDRSQLAGGQRFAVPL